MTSAPLAATLAAASPAFAADLARVQTEAKGFRATHVIDGVEVSLCGNVQRSRGKTFRSYDINIDLADGDVGLHETTDGFVSTGITFSGSARKANAFFDKAEAIHKAGGTVGELVEMPALLAPVAALAMPRPDYDSACKAGDEDIVFLTVETAVAEALAA